MDWNSRRDPLTLGTPDATIRKQRHARISAVISRIRHLSHDTIEVVVQSRDDVATLAPHAGQFCTLKVPGVERPRPYSLARAPSAEKPGEYTFFIRLLPDGELSNWFAESDRTGIVIDFAGPFGNFGLDDTTNALVCIAGGSGMSAIYAILEDACEVQVQRDCYFFYGARATRDLYLGEEITALRGAWHPRYRFEYIPVLSGEPAASNWPGARGRVSDVAVAAVDNSLTCAWSRTTALLCGPPAMIDAGLAGLDAAGLPRENCYYDRFEDMQAAAPVIDNRNCVLCDECLLVKPVAGCIVETGQLRFDRAGDAVGYEKLDPTRSSSLYYNSLFIDEGQCIRCHLCIDACPHGAIVIDGNRSAWTLRQSLTGKSVT